MDRRIVVTPEKLASALTVWLRVMPRRIWRELEKYHLAAKEKRQGTRPEVEREVAEHLAGAFRQSGWEVTHREPEHPGSPPPAQPPGNADPILDPELSPNLPVN